MSVDDLDAEKASNIFDEHGCLVVRGLMKPYIERIHQDIEAAATESLALLDEAQQIVEGWRTPNGTLFIPAPTGYDRDKQIMVLAVNYQTSAAFFHSAFDENAVKIVTAILGPNVEIFGNGQCLYKEPVGGHPKHLHQDSAYFEHRYQGPVGILNYVVDTDLVNGALYVVPGSHKLGQLKHIDTFSHLGLEEDEWPWESALPVEGKAGDSIFFNVKTIHGSKQNMSDKPRPVFINRYRRTDDFVIIGGTTAANRAEAEKRAAAAEEAKKANSDRGLMVQGFRPYNA
ncbi:phytanoyl-CoA dioxygenase family protein [Candidatus Poribacteria bacterium]|nr:phytanoyl-CoA dioxygenase family protein [Candidatus Poribacteria bacterium]MYB65708.1 phytanoyl-CoA dioxygenase family protein [Candidatus Poribacteria bacterium]MYF54841.1 phytanoyl-CoA dioxygenase family protein [Candidatus Poribacteria bacterium]MYI94135.1 phytanoyl-CoA dioxygenase family protein [Candidatus Poribacteria bacterium]